MMNESSSIYCAGEKNLAAVIFFRALNDEYSFQTKGSDILLLNLYEQYVTNIFII